MIDEEITKFKVINESKDNLEVCIDRTDNAICILCFLIMTPFVLFFLFIRLIDAFPESEKLGVISIVSVIYFFTIIMILIGIIYVCSTINLTIDKKTCILYLNYDFKIFKREKYKISLGLIINIDIKESIYIS